MTSGLMALSAGSGGPAPLRLPCGPQRRRSLAVPPDVGRELRPCGDRLRPADTAPSPKPPRETAAIGTHLAPDAAEPPVAVGDPRPRPEVRVGCELVEFLLGGPLPPAVRPRFLIL